MPNKHKPRKKVGRMPKGRSQIMATIRSSNTKPEVIVRKLLFHNGYRYRLHYKELPGSPDITLTKYKVAIFVQGCFWHYHGCHISHLPKNNVTFWEKKIKRNIERDKKNLAALLTMGWRVLFIWECALMTKSRIPEGLLLQGIKNFLIGSSKADAIAPHTPT